MTRNMSRLLALTGCCLTGALAGQAEAQALPPYIGGTVDLTLTIQLFTPVPAGDTVGCSLVLSTEEISSTPPYTSGVFSDTGTAVGTINGNTATCIVSVPYLWNLADPTLDHITISYTAGIYPTSQTVVTLLNLANVRIATHSLLSIAVPPKGTVTSLAATTRL